MVVNLKLPLRRNVIRNEFPDEDINGGMFFRSVLKCAIVFSVTQHRFAQCALNAKNNHKIIPNGSTTSLITDGEGNKVGENVTTSDKSDKNDKNASLDKKINDDKEFPPSDSHEGFDFDYDYGVLPAITTELPDCILSRSEFYLSWWVNEDGSLRLPASRNGSSPGFADLSLKFQSEDAIFKHVSEMTSGNVHDVMQMQTSANAMTELLYLIRLSHS